MVTTYVYLLGVHWALLLWKASAPAPVRFRAGISSGVFYKFEKSIVLRISIVGDSLSMVSIYDRESCCATGGIYRGGLDYKNTRGMVGYGGGHMEYWWTRLSSADGRYILLHQS